MVLHADSGDSFSMVVDCGGSRAEHRKRLAKAFAERRRQHDFLVISHLDNDHVNGLEDLKDAGVSFRTVFLPHVDMSRYLLWMTLKLSASENANGILAGFARVARLLYGGHFGPVVLVRDPGDAGDPRIDVDKSGDHHASGEREEGDRVLSSDARQALAKANSVGTGFSCSTSLTFDLDWLIRFYSREWAFPDEVASIWNLKLLEGLRTVVDSTAADPACFDWKKFTADMRTELKKKADRSLAAELASLVPATDSRVPALQQLGNRVATGSIREGLIKAR